MSVPTRYAQKPKKLGNDMKLEELSNSIKQTFIFSESECRIIEDHVDKVINMAENGEFRKHSVDRMPLRKKYFFGEGYTYGFKMSKKGPGMERLYPLGYIDPIPLWIFQYVVNPLIMANVVPHNFINSVVINDYQPNGCIVSHIDPPHIFDRPIISLSLFSDSALCFGCKFEFRPIRCGEPILKLPLPRGIVTAISGFAANEITHCVRPEDTQFRRAVIILRRALPNAPRLSIDDPLLLNSTTKRVQHEIRQQTKNTFCVLNPKASSYCQNMVCNATMMARRNNFYDENALYCSNDNKISYRYSICMDQKPWKLLYQDNFYAENEGRTFKMNTKKFHGAVVNTRVRRFRSLAKPSTGKCDEIRSFSKLSQIKKTSLKRYCKRGGESANESNKTLKLYVRNFCCKGGSNHFFFKTLD